jgi:hypothetical protein
MLLLVWILILRQDMKRTETRMVRHVWFWLDQHNINEYNQSILPFEKMREIKIVMSFSSFPVGKVVRGFCC